MGHISTLNILAKANKSLGFLRSKFPEKIKKRTYQTIVRPNGKSYSGGKPGVWEITLFSVSSQTYGHLCV
jgi:hypothetical protein